MGSILKSGDLFHPDEGTVHIGAKLGEIAEIVLMGGDPLRAEKMAATFLTNVKKVSSIRNMFAFTGEYKGHRVTIMGHGMGLPSIGIYTYEIMQFYKAKIVIRIGTCGALVNNIDVGDLVIAQGACTNSRYAHQYQLPGSYSAISDFDLLMNAVIYAREHNVKHKVGNILSSDLFYDVSNSATKWGEKLNVLATEMETYALYCNAAFSKCRALTILTVSDHLIKRDLFQTPEERQNKTLKMGEVALEAAIKTIQTT